MRNTRKTLGTVIAVLLLAFTIASCPNPPANNSTNSNNPTGSNGAPAALSAAKAITAFSFPALGVTAAIDETNGTITAVVPNGTDRSGLVAAFSSTGQGVSVGGVQQVSGTTPNNFASVKMYTVTAADGSSRSYLVTVVIQPSGSAAPSWGKRLSNVGTSSRIKVDSNGNVYVIGYEADAAGANTHDDWRIRKFDSAGVEDTANWDKTINGASNRDDRAMDIAIDGANNVYVIGTTNYDWQDSYDITSDWWIKKFSSAGVEDTVHWNKTIDAGTLTDDEPYAIGIDGSGSVYVVGCYGTGGSFQFTGWWIKKFAADGTEDTTNWNKKLASGSGWLMAARAVDFDSSGNVYVAGTLNDYKSWVLRKFSSSGVEDSANWGKTITLSSGSYAFDLVVDRSANLVYVGGCGNNHGLIKKYNASGVEDIFNWNKVVDGGHGGPDQVLGLGLDGQRNLFAAGIMDQANGGTPYACWISKYAPSGAEDTANWNKLIPLGPTEGAKSIAFDSSNNVYVASNSWYVWKFTD